MTEWNQSAGMWIVKCPDCETRHGISNAIYQAAQERRERMAVFCPNGHKWAYLTGESDLDKMRRERDRLKQDAARLEDQARRAREDAEAQKRSAAAYKGAATRMKNRAKAGVCPCCNRHFVNLERHMKSQHSDEDLTNVVELGQASK